MKSKDEHEVIFKSYPAVKLRDIIKKTNITLTGLTKKEIVEAMLKRRRAFDWLNLYNGIDSYKNHPKYKALVKEKEKEEFKKDVKSNQKVRKFKGGGRTKVVVKEKDKNKKAIKNPTYQSVSNRGAVRNTTYQSISP